MFPLIVIFICFFAYFLGFRFYSKLLSEKVFSLRGSEVKTPAHTLNDGVDYVPTKPIVLFGHHFASIAGLAPILGPAVAVIWGWLPAMLWVVFGALFIGCVHDMGSLVVSVRHQGKSIGQVASDIIGTRARTLFHIIIFFLVSLAMGVFVLVISGLYSAPSLQTKKAIPVIEKKVTLQELEKKHDQGNLKAETPTKITPKSNFPEAITPTATMMIIALVIGYLGYKKGYSLNVLTVFGFTITVGSIFLGMYEPFMEWTGFADPGRSPNPDQWKIILLIYGFLASVTPVWLLLQSRDYINSFLLYTGIILVYLGFIVGGLGGHFDSFHTDAIRQEPIGLDLIPFVFITIACGAASGFHSLVSSGTTAKQLNQEKDARIIGYGAMMGESLLGLTAVVACTVGFNSNEEWMSFYRSWSGIQGLSVQVGAYIFGTSRFMSHIGIPQNFGQGFIALVVISFALTSLDSATRLLRYNIEEIVDSIPSTAVQKVFKNRYISSLLACLAIGFFAFLKVEQGGKLKPAGLALWKLFGTTNQLLAGLALLVIVIYLFRSKKPVIYVLLPMIFILFVTLWAMVGNFFGFLFGETPSLMLAFVGGILILLTIWLCIEGMLVIKKNWSNY
ncbi:MAG: carbon starvation protein A [Leptospiraceae bacterium]|nr:carbon starvation protein A [Leptospiraceae bacterium]MCP5493300.1 carbon starvation protein A [Leptospiraceae bacterium]